MTPTIGRIVLYRSHEVCHDDEAHPAIITRVWSGTCVNLKVLADGVQPFDKTSVLLEDKPGQLDRWSWPPRVEAFQAGA